MLDTRYQGEFAEQYIKTLALAAGLNPAKCGAVDDDGVDVTIGYSGTVGMRRSPSIKAQVKSWSGMTGTADYWHYDGLNEVQYDQLAGPGHTDPRFLVLLRVPVERTGYAEFHPDGLLLRHHAYFLAMELMPRIDAPRAERKRRVHVPKANVLTAESLRRLLHPELVTARSGS